MSKLKAGVIVTPHNEGMSFSRDSDHVSVTEGETKFYLKSEVDECISEIKKERDWLAKDRAQAYDDLEKRAQLNIRQEKSSRHQKYKRCVAMTKWCFAKANFHYIIGRKEGRQFAKDNFRRGNLYSKWCDRWKKLAEQFKEAK